MKHVPQRTCVACRQVRPKRDLLRIVRSPQGEVAVDATGKAPGRGAYICRSCRCAEQAVKQKKLVRALGGPLADDILESIGQSLERS